MRILTLKKWIEESAPEDLEPLIEMVAERVLRKLAQRADVAAAGSRVEALKQRIEDDAARGAKPPRGGFF